LHKSLIYGIFTNMDISEHLRNLISDKLNKLGISPFTAAKRAGLPQDAIRYVLDGKEPGLSRALYICKSLEIPFNIGDFEFSINDEFVLIKRVAIKASAGNGNMVFEERLGSSLAFRRKWLENKHLKPENLSILEVAGDSMEHRILDGDLVLINHQYGDFRSGCIYVVRIEDDLLCKYVQKIPDGTIQCFSENTKYPMITIKDDNSAIVGRVEYYSHDMGN